MSYEIFKSSVSVLTIGTIAYAFFLSLFKLLLLLDIPVTGFCLYLFKLQ